MTCSNIKTKQIKNFLTKYDIHLDISLLTGEELLKRLCKLVDRDWWKTWRVTLYVESTSHLKKYKKVRDHYTKDIIKGYEIAYIQTKPTEEQPGNGLIWSRNKKGFLSTFSYKITRRKNMFSIGARLRQFEFTHVWKEFFLGRFKTNFKKFSYLDLAGCLLLTFEISRRHKNDFEQLKRFEVEQAVMNVMEFEEDIYRDQVGH